MLLHRLCKINPFWKRSVGDQTQILTLDGIPESKKMVAATKRDNDAWTIYHQYPKCSPNFIVEPTKPKIRPLTFIN